MDMGPMHIIKIMKLMQFGRDEKVARTGDNGLVI